MASLIGACAGVEDETSSTEQHGMSLQGMSLQGMSLQGMSLQGMSLQGMSLQGHRFDGATLSGSDLANVRIEGGELVAERDGATVRGTQLVGARLLADAYAAADPATQTQVEYRIAAISAELAAYDPTHTGGTYLYTLEQNAGDDTWQPACPVDADGRRVAIPVAATWSATGARVESSTLFTFGCTTGVIAKCYRWGYRPWVSGYGDLVELHQTCTRLARADYCGDGTSHTHDGTWVNLWDRLPAPGPIQSHGGPLPPLGMLFEAGWNADGAVCLSHTRWVLGGLVLAQLCPDRLVPPGVLGATVCNSVSGVLGFDPDATLFNESYVNLW